MLINNSSLKRIDDLIDKAYANLAYILLGDAFLTDKQKVELAGLGLIVGRKPLIDLLYSIVRNRPTNGYPESETLSKLLNTFSVLGILPITSDTQQYTLDGAKADINEAIENAKAELKKKIKRKILNANKEHKVTIIKERQEAHQTKTKKDESLTGLLLGITALLPVIQKVFNKGFTTEMTGLINDATVDSLIETAILQGLSSKDTLVYKKVVNDSSLCSWCEKFYLNEDGTPKIYRLAELEANGINDPAKKSAWKAVISATHPLCRCQLHKV